MKNKNNAILISKIDEEDFWVCGGMVFKVENTKTFEDAYNEIKHRLEAPEVIESIVGGRHLLSGLFNDDESFKFIRTEWYGGLNFVFKNDDDEEVEYTMSVDFLWIP